MAEPPDDHPSWKNRLGLTAASLLLFFLVLFSPSWPGLEPAGQRLAAVVVLMALLWCTQAWPLAVTSLVPLVAFPFLGIQPAGEVSKAYMSATILLYVAGFAIAIGIERWGLHRRLALGVLSLLGTGPKRVVLGFMTGTALMSMWISNTASTLLMLPIALAVLDSLQVDHADEAQQQRLKKKFGIALLLGVAYSASIGGMATLIGTPTNGVYVGYWTSSGSSAEEIERYAVSLGQWVLMFLPLTLVMLAAVWGALCIPVWTGVSFGEAAQRQVRDQYRELGRMSPGEFRMLIIFGLTALLWISRVSLDVGGLHLVGWQDALSSLMAETGIQYKGLLHDSTAGLLMMILMFLVPVRNQESGKQDFLMDWDTLEQKLPWGILLLFGGGFAIASACTTTGLSNWLGTQIAQQMQSMGNTMQIASVASLVIFLTEFTSNTATIATLLPILEETALALELDPRMLMLPATIAASCAFMLPIATPPNAIVFSANRLTVWDMMKVGFLLNLIGIAVVTFMTMFWVIRVGQLA